ncbi:MAG: MobC family plasmid mobilization relaxosome protein [Novosphingobium sp.]|uniref:MobC family plasmid mobilization relaxosome protein n=1 Tax=Novosphingobium sp. TaxID=1874826 RepID=UPI003B9C95F8
MTVSKARPHQINFRVSPEEFAVLAAKAAMAGVTVTEFVRLTALERRMPVHDPQAKEALRELSRIGGNINQIAKVANTTGAIAGIDAALIELRAAVARIG